VGLFEFLMILVSVVIGLGVAEILSGAANLLRARKTVRFHWLHALFQVGVFFALLQQWWEAWEMHGLDEISFGAVLTMLVPPVLIFLMAHLLYPEPAENADLERYYFEQAPVLWGLAALGTLEGTFIRPLAAHDGIFEPNNLAGFPMVALCTWLVLTEHRRTHLVVAPLILGLLILDTVLANPVISVP
jgi:hypothetical protein